MRSMIQTPDTNTDTPRPRGEFWIAMCGLAACGAAMADLAVHGADADKACQAKRAEFAAVSKNFGDMRITTELKGREAGFVLPFIATTCELNP